jgi:CBS domain containing-hemolysin-like protein
MTQGVGDPGVAEAVDGHAARDETDLDLLGFAGIACREARHRVAAIGDPDPILLIHGIALTIAFIFLSAIHVVLGELVPKTISLARAERVALMIARPFLWFLTTFRWAIDFLDNISGAIVKALGLAIPTGHGVAHSTEELQIQIQQARERGLLAPGEEKFILSAIELGHLQVREIMVSRPDMHVLPIEASLDEPEE